MMKKEKNVDNFFVYQYQYNLFKVSDHVLKSELSGSHFSHGRGTPPTHNTTMLKRNRKV